MNDMLLTMGIAVLLEYLKSKSDRSKWRRAFLKVFKAIADAYKDDPEFKGVITPAQVR